MFPQQCKIFMFGFLFRHLCLCWWLWTGRLFCGAVCCTSYFLPGEWWTLWHHSVPMQGYRCYWHHICTFCKSCLQVTACEGMWRVGTTSLFCKLQSLSHPFTLSIVSIVYICLYMFVFILEENRLHLLFVVYVLYLLLAVHALYLLLAVHVLYL